MAGSSKAFPARSFASHERSGLHLDRSTADWGSCGLPVSDSGVSESRARPVVRRRLRCQADVESYYRYIPPGPPGERRQAGRIFIVFLKRIPLADPRDPRAGDAEMGEPAVSKILTRYWILPTIDENNSMLAVSRQAFSVRLLTPFALRWCGLSPRHAPFMSINCSKRSSSSEQKGLFILDAIVRVRSKRELHWPLGVSPVHQETLTNNVLAVSSVTQDERLGHSTAASAFGPPSL